MDQWLSQSRRWLWHKGMSQDSLHYSQRFKEIKKIFEKMYILKSKSVFVIENVCKRKHSKLEVKE